MHSLVLKPASALAGTVTLPGSKSISNRALLLASLAAGQTRIGNLLDSDDVRLMLSALAQLGIRTEPDGDTILVHGRGGPLVDQDVTHSLNLGLAGTALRPLAAALTTGRGRSTTWPRKVIRRCGSPAPACRVAPCGCRETCPASF
jgi:3-phosphoshikimate 1-carboxyvinyltransferase